MIPNLKFLLLFSLLKIISTTVDYDEVQIEDMYETRSRIIMVDGNVWLHAGKDKNITFKTFGAGKIYVDETDVSKLPDTASFNKLVGRVDSANSMIVNLRNVQNTQMSAIRVVLGSAKHYLLAFRNMTSEISALKKWKSDKMVRDMRRRGLLVKMTRQIIKINKLIAMNACDSNKCENGGTCIPRFGPKFTCLCPPHFTGQKCEADVDECSVYQNTLAGCQNNGTCVNKHGGFECTCPSGFHGPLCQYRMSACSKTFELCGPHGHCIENVGDGVTTAAEPGYRCICDWGFKVSGDKNNPTCVDVDECESNPCHPGIACINMPGSFVCSGCPPGYKSEGNACIDVNECESEVPPCSSVAKCYNTIGSYHCGECPDGYSGNGKNCAKDDVCRVNSCHPLAVCKPTTDGIAPYTCFCPEGYIGNGMHADGCRKSETTVCQSHKCVNGGICIALNETDYRCGCENGFFGKFCEKPSPCLNNPCQNGGTCMSAGFMAFCDCTQHFFGQYCEQEEEHCGGHFTHTTGNYTFDLSASNSSKICDFVFNVIAVNSAVRLTFTSFDNFSEEGEGPTDCATTVANLTLYDGNSDVYTPLATFCGDSHSVHAPLSDTPITMTSTGAMLRFRGTQGTFGVEWETVERKCGFRTSKPEGILSVPQNKQDIVCEWFITAPGGKIIEVTIPPIAMHSKDSDNCEQNSLEIFDGYATYDRHRILETCASTLEPQVVKSTGPFLSVSFVSNMIQSVSGLETIRGFSISYKFTNPDRECGGEIDNVDGDFSFSGTIESPNYGSLYPANMDCTWKINGSLGNDSYSGDMVLKLTFDQFDVVSGYSTSSPAGLHYRAFRRFYPSGILAAIGPGASRTYRYMSMMDMGSCTDDYLRILDGDGTMVYEGCNPRRPPNSMTVNNPAAVVRFHSNDREQGKGFRIQYEMLCQKRVSGNGTIQTWNFPNGGTAGKCTYIIDAPRTHVIYVRFLTIGLRVLPMSECFYSPKGVENYPDYIEMAAGRTDNTIFNRRYVCARYPFVEGNWLSVSAVRPLKITVASSGNEQFKGLSLEYKTADVGCGGLLSSMTGTFSSPNYPEKYMSHMHCVYQIFVSWSKVVKLSFDVFDLEVTQTTGCDYDRVEIYTSYHNETTHGELLGKFCGALIPPTIFSKTNTMSVVFVSDRSVAGQGFNAKFEAVSRSTNCDYTMTAPTGNLEFSPLIQRFDKCTFHIAVHDNQRVLIRVHNMTLPCDKSSLAFRNGPEETSPPFSSLPSDSEVCTPKVNFLPVLRSFSNRVMIIFKSVDSRNTYFNISYETVSSGCGGRVDGLSGIVSAPQYPLGDKKNMRCEWTVAVALGNRVRFALTAIDDLSSADSAGFCPVFSNTRLDFYNSLRQGNQHLKRFCAKELASEPITSDDNELLIKYVQAGGFQSKKIFGFSGHFTTVCTGIVLDGISGSIQSPGYPHRVYTNQFCTWTIRVPKGNRVFVTMHHFSISSSPYSIDCQGNSLKVDDTDLSEAQVAFGSQLNTTTSVNRFCEKASPKHILSRHNSMKLTYTSHSAPTNQFWLSWNTVGCSRDIMTPQTIIATKEHIDPEADEFECRYKIVAPVGKRIKVMVDRLDILPIDSGCDYSADKDFTGLAVFMGSSNASGLAFKTFCSPLRKQNISSQTNELFILISLNKDHLRTKDNVFLNFTVIFAESRDNCGGIVFLKRGVTNTIVSPNFPAPYPAGISCRWLVYAPQGYHIEYTVNEFHSPNHHEERAKGSRLALPGRSNFTCRWMLPYTDGMLSFFSGNSSKTDVAVEKICEESSEPKVIPMYAAQSIILFEGATTMSGRKSGEDARDKNGFSIEIRPKCGGVVFAESKPQTISLFHEGEDVCNITIRKRDPEDADIYIRLEEYTKLNASAQHSIDDRIDIYVGGELQYTVMLSATDTTMQEYSSDEDEMMLSVQHADAPHSAVIVYSTDERSCGGEVRHQSGTILAPTRRLDRPFDCGWSVTNNVGNSVKVSILNHNLRSSPDCTDSYIEVRAHNSSGKLLKRQCDTSDIDTSVYEEQSLYIFLRFRPNTDDGLPDVEESNSERPLFKAKYERVSGGTPKSDTISNPKIDDVSTMTWKLDIEDDNQGILIKFQEVYLPRSTSYLRFSETVDGDEEEDGSYQEVTGVMIPEEKFFSTRSIRVYARLEKKDQFTFTWEAVPSSYKNNTAVKVKEKKVYDCGGVITSSYDWDSFTNPLPAGQSFGYEENLHCRWIITRPMFTGVELKFEYLDLENVENCAYDFVTFRMQFDLEAGQSARDDDDIDFTSVSKHCALARSNNSFFFSVNRALHIHFVTDRSRHGIGFKLKHRLTCNSFEHIRPGITFETNLQSPNYDGSLSPREWKCQYSIITETNRKIFVQIMDLDIEEKTPCDNSDVLFMGSRYNEIEGRTDQYSDSKKYCGSAIGANFTTTRGRLYIRYNAKTSNRKGFRLLLREVMTECPSGVLHLDESTPSRTLQSPEFPQRIPNSVDCDYVMAAPNGHRVALTFEPDNFDIDGEIGNCGQMDFLEVRDGPSVHSQLVGVYCGNRPPSTIYSTGNFLYMRLRTAEYGRSRQFVARYEIATCGGTIIVHENSTSHITSPNYPDPFASPVACEWSVHSPNTHMLDVKFDHLWLLYNQNCTMERVAVLDGNSTAPAILGPACSSRTLSDDYVRSASNQLTVQFSSNSTVTRGGRQYCNNKKCGFNLAIKLSDKKCGGTISDAQGTLMPPGFPGLLLPHVRCVWDFVAKPGNVYRFHLNFTGEDAYRTYPMFVLERKKECFADVKVIEGIRPFRETHNQRHFCRDEEYITSSTDVSRIVYDDVMTREIISRFGTETANQTFYMPFTIGYLLLPVDKENRGCSFQVVKNSTFELGNGGINVQSLCHFHVLKPLNYGSMSVRIDNYTFISDFPDDKYSCPSYDAHMRLTSNDPVPIEKVFCNAIIRKNQTELVFINSDLDIMLVETFRATRFQQMNLTIEFQRCGGIVRSPNVGVITSPNYGTGLKYLPDSRCRWVLEAPEGQIVKIKIVEMRIVYDHECADDHLLVGEGRQADMNVIHKYCHKTDGAQEEKLEERFRTVRSRGRYLSLLWATDSKSEETGWKLEYEFVNEDDECGYHTRGMSGVITTPKFGSEDYENDLECVWDVQVPVGYHLNLHFVDFDVQTSEQCQKDALLISQEHSTRANSPAGDYYFLFRDEEKETPLCGIDQPKDFQSESNRVRLNFTTDSKTTARGFRINWEAKCGTIYRLNHGVVSSPDYPEGYPNEVSECTYLIAPKDQNSVVALKFSDFDLSNDKNVFGRSPCEEDHLQIIEASTDRVVMTLCGGSPAPEDPLVIKGSVGLKFVSDKSFLWSTDAVRGKKNRGFQLAYSISKCGENIELRDGTRLVTAISSPAFPLPYARDLDCIWNITADPDRVLHVRFEQLNMEDYNDCSADYVELFDGADVADNKTLGKYCGTMKKAPRHRLMTTGPNLSIRMKTDFNFESGGFKLYVTATLGPKSGCGGKLTATSSWQTLSSPRDEDGNYPAALMCGWLISGPVDSQLRIRIDGVDTEELQYPPGIRPDPECIDSLAVYDGQENFSPPLALDLCTSPTPLPKVLFSSHRHAFVTFETDRDGTGKGFNISYAIVENECGGWIRAESDVKTLEYKGITKEENKEVFKERTHQRCRFMIQGSKTEPVIVNFRKFNIPSKAGDCSDSYVEIRDVGSLQECQHPACAREPHQRKITKLCGTNVPSHHISNTNTIQIIVSAEIVASTNLTRPSFKFDYNLLDNCNRTIETNVIKSGRLTSPNYPLIYSENSTCSTQLKSDNQKMLIAFSEFSLEDADRSKQFCEYDYLKISEEGSNGTRYCGTDLPETFLTSGKDLTALFKSDHSLSHGGYDATYFTVVSETDDKIQFANSYEMDGVISNIGYPNGYNKSMSQVFVIRPPSSHDCSFIFSDLNIGLTETREQCLQPTEEFLEVEIMFKDQTRKARIRECSFRNTNARELILDADNTERYVKFTFKSDTKSENDGRGFKIRWSCHSIGHTQMILE